MKNIVVYIVLSFVFCLDVADVQSQNSLHFTGGGIYNVIRVPSLDVSARDPLYKPAIGYHFGVHAERKVASRFGLASSLQFRNLPFTVNNSLRNETFHVDQYFIGLSIQPMLYSQKGLDYFLGAEAIVLLRKEYLDANRMNFLAQAGIRKTYGKLGVGLMIGHSVVPFLTFDNRSQDTKFYHRFANISLYYRLLSR
jgi:hypothetical protein